MKRLVVLFVLLLMVAIIIPTSAQTRTMTAGKNMHVSLAQHQESPIHNTT